FPQTRKQPYKIVKVKTLGYSSEKKDKLPSAIPFVINPVPAHSLLIKLKPPYFMTNDKINTGKAIKPTHICKKSVNVTDQNPPIYVNKRNKKKITTNVHNKDHRVKPVVTIAIDTTLFDIIPRSHKIVANVTSVLVRLSKRKTNHSEKECDPQRLI